MSRHRTATALLLATIALGQAGCDRDTERSAHVAGGATEAGARNESPTPAAKPSHVKPDTGRDASPLLNPELAMETAPQNYQIRFDTTKGPVLIEVNRSWAPNGADRLYNLAKIGYFKDVAFFRAIEGFMVQFGISGDPDVNTEWDDAYIRDDPVVQSNKRGYLTFAKPGQPHSRTTQLFINQADGNAQLDSQGFAPVGLVIQGMSVVDSLYNGYGDGPPGGRGPDQGKFRAEGNAYLDAKFPKLDYIRTATVVEN